MEILEALNFDIWTFSLMAINLLIVIAFLYKFLYTPVGKVLAQREEKIEGSLKKAAEERASAQVLLGKYEEQIAQAKSDAQEMVSLAAKLGDEMRDKIVHEARDEATKILARAKIEIAGEKAKAMTEVRDEIATLVVAAAGQVIQKELSLEDHEAMLKDFVARAGEAQ